MTDTWGSRRERTAISRAALSMPARQSLLDGVLRAELSVLDYGSGRGQDVVRLGSMGFKASGWDPYYAEDRTPQPADVVLLIYVLNVIESAEERATALRHAWSLSRGTLVVSSRLHWERRRISGRELDDGILTNRGTFQHLFEPGELRRYVEDHTGARCVAGAPGVVYAFRDETERLSFLSRRLAPDATWGASETLSQALQQVVSFAEVRGRLPALEEMPDPVISLLGANRVRSLPRLVRSVADPDRVSAGARRSTLDTLLFLGTERFNGESRLRQLPVAVQADVRAFFPSFQDAVRRADRLLLKIRDDVYLRGAMRNSVGKLTPTALYVHRRAASDMPVVLRLYEHCGAIAAGRPSDYTLVKLSHDKRAVSWLSYPDFDSDPHPRTSWSYSVSFPGFEVTHTDFEGRLNRPLLHRKEEFLAPDDPLVPKFSRLTKQELKAGLYLQPSLIGTEDGWNDALQRCGVELRGHRLVSRRQGH